MKNIKIVQSCLVKGEHVEAGTKLREVESHLAADLISQGRAIELPGGPEVVTDRDSEPENRDPKPAKKAKDAPAE